MNYSRRILIFFVCVFLVFASAYLASMSGNNTQEALNQRVLTEWEARSNGKWGVVYDLTADVFKKKVTRSGFVEKANIRIETPRSKKNGYGKTANGVWTSHSVRPRSQKTNK